MGPGVVAVIIPLSALWGRCLVNMLGVPSLAVLLRLTDDELFGAASDVTGCPNNICLACCRVKSVIVDLRPLDCPPDLACLEVTTLVVGGGGIKPASPSSTETLLDIDAMLVVVAGRVPGTAGPALDVTLEVADI